MRDGNLSGLNVPPRMEPTLAPTTRAPRLPSAKRYDLGVAALTALAGFFSGIALTLAFLMSASFQDLVLLGALILVTTATVFFLIQRRTARQTHALDDWARANDNERAHFDAARQTNEQSNTQLRAELNELESQVAALTQTKNPLRVPLIFGWQALDLPETESAPQLAILAELFQGHPQIYIQKKFSGGYRNHGVYQVRSPMEADRIVKIARSADIRAERRAQELINQFSQNNGGQYVRDVQSADDAAYGGIVYRVALLRREANIASFDAFYHETQNTAACVAVVEQLFNEALPHSQFRQIRPAALFQEHALHERALKKIAAGVQETLPLAEGTLESETVRVVVGSMTLPLRNPLYWAERVMPQFFHVQLPAVLGVIHGDMHSRNLLVESPSMNVWIIDFAKTRADAHTLTDFARVETDLKFCLLPDDDANYFEQALNLETKLLAPRATDELELAHDAFENHSAAFQKAASSILALRRIAARHRRDLDTESVGHFADASVLPYYLALFQATLRTCKYAQCTRAQKTFAFVSAGMLCERIMQLVEHARE